VNRTPKRELQRLSALHGVQASYRNVRTGKTERASGDTLVAVLRALGAPLGAAADAPDALAARNAELAARVLPRTIVAWDGRAADIALALPVAARGRRVECVVEAEDGGTTRWAASGSARSVRLPSLLPHGAHRLHVRWGSESRTATVLSAPRRLASSASAPRRGWGTFLPLYAARSHHDWGCGGLAELESLAAFTRAHGGTLVATLPMFATFLSRPYDPSPYAPVSRLFWNEHFLDLPSLPEFAKSPRAREVAEAASNEIASLRALPLVDWTRVREIHRRVLAPLAAAFFGDDGVERDRFERCLAGDPLLMAYARFRAAGETRGEGFRSWPERMRRGTLGASDAPPDAVRVHLYAQWRFEEALTALSGKVRTNGVELYLDLPLGVHAEGFDPWRYPERFAEGVSGGAPPDRSTWRGQDWGFPPLHPERGGEEGHLYFRQCLRKLLRHAAVLRIDHVMSLHRLWWVPRGFSPEAGVYVTYPSEELYAALCLEASRTGSAIVGEDLGTVPPSVRPAMRRHGLGRTWAVQRQLVSDPDGAFADVPAAATASLNTHDHPTFAGWWKERDIDDRLALGLLDAEGGRRERARRERARRVLGTTLRTPRGAKLAPIAKTLAALGATSAQRVVVSVEDLWGETQPQNVPGTTDQRPNWRRRARWDQERIGRSRTVRETIAALDRARRKEDSG